MRAAIAKRRLTPLSDAATCLTPPELARRWRTSPDKILGFIGNGQLRAFNVAASPSGRPRWRIALVDVLAFERTRAAQSRPASAPRRRKAAAGVIEFF